MLKDLSTESSIKRNAKIYQTNTQLTTGGIARVSTKERENENEAVDQENSIISEQSYKLLSVCSTEFGTLDGVEILQCNMYSRYTE